jgi:hypothetical protein
MTTTPDVRTRQIVWRWQQKEIALGVDEAGDRRARI